MNRQQRFISNEQIIRLQARLWDCRLDYLNPIPIPEPLQKLLIDCYDALTALANRPEVNPDEIDQTHEPTCICRQCRIEHGAPSDLSELVLQLRTWGKVAEDHDNVVHLRPRGAS
jgi:hypothetical protein